MENESEESCKIHIDLLAKAANNGDCVAQYDMANGYDIAFNWFGYDYYSDCKYESYMECLTASSQNGYLPAMCELGETYRDGYYTRKNIKKAFSFIKEAAEASLPEAKFILGCMYADGIGTGVNDTAAFRNIWQAAMSEYADALYMLARFMNDSRWENYTHVYSKIYYILWLTQAANFEVEEAQYELAQCFASSKMLKYDASKVIKWMTAAANNNLYKAQFELALMYRDGKHVETDEKRAFKYMKKAAAVGYECAYCCLGAMYRRGCGTRVNFKKAFYYFEKATCEFAKAHMGCMLLRGYGVKKDISKAVEYLQKAAKLNEPHALYHLGECYENGWGLECNRRKAINCYLKAVKFDENYDDAKDALKRLTKK